MITKAMERRVARNIKLRREELKVERAASQKRMTERMRRNRANGIFDYYLPVNRYGQYGEYE